jgi:hypothetical protein
MRLKPVIFDHGQGNTPQKEREQGLVCWRHAHHDDPLCNKGLEVDLYYEEVL